MDFIIIWYECSLGGPLLDSLKKFWSDKKHGRRGQVKLSKKFKGLLLFEASCSIQLKFDRNDPWVFLYQNY